MVCSCDLRYFVLLGSWPPSCSGALLKVFFMYCDINLFRAIVDFMLL